MKVPLSDLQRGASPQKYLTPNYNFERGRLLIVRKRVNQLKNKMIHPGKVDTATPHSFSFDLSDCLCLQ